MNRIQILGRKLEADRLKLQMGLDPALDIEMHRLRAMWRQLEAERQARVSKAARDFREVRVIEEPSSPASRLVMRSR